MPCSNLTSRDDSKARKPESQACGSLKFRSILVCFEPEIEIFMQKHENPDIRGGTDTWVLRLRKVLLRFVFGLALLLRSLRRRLFVGRLLRDGFRRGWRRIYFALRWNL